MNDSRSIHLLVFLKRINIKRLLRREHQGLFIEFRVLLRQRIAGITAPKSKLRNIL